MPSPSDRPDYTKPIAFALQEVPDWGPEAWAAKGAEYTVIYQENTIPVNPGEEKEILTYTLPEGKRFLCYSVSVVADFRFAQKNYLPGGIVYGTIRSKPYAQVNVQMSMPSVFEYAYPITVKIRNDDIIAGYWEYYVYGFEVEASKPKNPKKDDPEERYKLHDWNVSSGFNLPGNQVAIFFYKAKEKKMNYLRFKNLYKPKEKKLASLHLKPQQAQKIMSTIRGKPEKAIEVLAGLEKKYKV